MKRSVSFLSFLKAFCEISNGAGDFNPEIYLAFLQFL